MGFDDMLGDDHRKHRGLREHDDGHHHGHNHNHRDDERYSYRPRDDEDGRYSQRRYDRDDDVDIERLFRLILANRKLMIAVALVVVVVIVLAVIFLLPLLGPALDTLDKSGVKGVAERVLQESGSGK
jgi:hypothetical protein